MNAMMNLVTQYTLNWQDCLSEYGNFWRVLNWPGRALSRHSRTAWGIKFIQTSRFDCCVRFNWCLHTRGYSDIVKSDANSVCSLTFLLSRMYWPWKTVWFWKHWIFRIEAGAGNWDVAPCRWQSMLGPSHHLRSLYLSLWTKLIFLLRLYYSLSGKSAIASLAFTTSITSLVLCGQPRSGADRTKQTLFVQLRGPGHHEASQGGQCPTTSKTTGKTFCIRLQLWRGILEIQWAYWLGAQGRMRIHQRTFFPE